MDLDSIECVSSSDGMDEDEIQHHSLHPHPHHHSEFSSTKPRNGGANNNNNIIGPTAIAPATSVHELLECPVCTNSMFPPIHQVSSFSDFHLLQFFLYNFLVRLYIGGQDSFSFQQSPIYLSQFGEFDGSGVGLSGFAGVVSRNS